ncbi:hypothetical protein BDV33DRAFT_200159 [Aspergillus novoparasiticus]|uniref:BTB domain-containing protein n=1 Tax=Aspergillus novoparasiticus TaxID=986946 RepID=A0A5N6F3M8_9EURO|nr:hypothetical protein BDV33DRAFT_200159 [Aspergillus novoparasiticus]
MPDILYEFDPDGDVTFIIKDAPESLPHNLSDFNATLLSQLYTNQSNSTKISGLPTLHIRASSKHLMLASPHFRGTFRNAFQEGNELRSAGHINIKICDWKPVPFLMLMAVFHGQTQLVPQSLCFDWLTEMAILVDYYDCYKAVAMVSDLWTKDFEKKQSTLSKRNPMEWLRITWAFRKKDAFESITKYFQLEYTGEISPDELPISARIIQRHYFGTFEKQS